MYGTSAIAMHLARAPCNTMLDLSWHSKMPIMAGGVFCVPRGRGAQLLLMDRICVNLSRSRDSSRVRPHYERLVCVEQPCRMHLEPRDTDGRHEK